MSYFSTISNYVDISRIKIFERRNRISVSGLPNSLIIASGDILEVFFLIKGLVYVFEGLCLSVKQRGYLNPNMTCLLRNFIQNVGIECNFCFFYNRIYFLRIHDFKRKFYGFSRSKLYFLKENLLKIKKKINI